MKKKKVSSANSIEEIAASLQLSPATVSRVLNNHPHVHQETRAKVMKMVERVGYRRNIMASGLRTNKTGIIGMIVPRISMFIQAAIITIVQDGLHARGYNLIICQSNESVETEKELARTLFASCVEAVIVACTLFTTDFSHFDILTKNNVPVIFYDRVPTKSYPALTIKGDDFRGAYLGASHLIELGCRRIAYISGPLSCSIYVERLAGFRNAMSQNDVPVIENMIFYQELNVANARKAMHALFSKEPYPDGIFATNDTTALVALEFAKERSIPVPQNLKIVGYSNDPRSSIVSPSITSIEQFPDRVGKSVVDELLKILNKNNGAVVPAELTPVVTPVQLIRRMST